MANVKKARPKYIVIKDKDNEKEYKLGFTREVLSKMESDGFNISELESMPITTMTMLITYSFERFHPMLTDDQRLEIFDDLENKEELIPALTTLWANCVEGLTSSQNNRLKWKMV